MRAEITVTCEDPREVISAILDLAVKWAVAEDGDNPEEFSEMKDEPLYASDGSSIGQVKVLR